MTQREDGFDNFLEYCKARCKDFQGLDDVNQSMIEVNVVPGIVNNLHPTSAPPTPPAKLPLKCTFPPPYLFETSFGNAPPRLDPRTVPKIHDPRKVRYSFGLGKCGSHSWFFSTFRTLWFIPSIMTKLESYLLVKELNARVFQNAIIEQQLLIALSTPAAYTEVNYERLEFLGKYRQLCCPLVC